jgi:hypothetical protein
MPKSVQKWIKDLNIRPETSPRSSRKYTGIDIYWE